MDTKQIANKKGLTFLQNESLKIRKTAKGDLLILINSKTAIVIHRNYCLKILNSAETEEAV